MTIQHVIDTLVILTSFVFLMFMQRRNTPVTDAILMGLFLLCGFGSSILTLIKLIVQ